MCLRLRDTGRKMDQVCHTSEVWHTCLRLRMSRHNPDFRRGRLMQILIIRISKTEGLPDGSGYPAEALRQAQCDREALALWRSSSEQPGLKLIVALTMRAPNKNFEDIDDMCI